MIRLGRAPRFAATQPVLAQLGFFFAAAFLFALVVWSAIPPIDKSQQQHQSATTDTKSSPPSRATSRPDELVGAAQEQDEPQRDSDGLKFWQNVKADPLVWFTFMLVVIGGLQALIFWHQLDATRAIERAYITITETGPLTVGVAFVATGKAEQHNEIVIPVEVKNFGHTPATVAGVDVHTWYGKQLPEDPPYRVPTKDRAEQASFLVSGAAFRNDFKTVEPVSSSRPLKNATGLMVSSSS